MSRLRLRLAAATFAGLATATAGAGGAAAQDFPDITDRDFALDLYEGAVLGSTRIVGMGGAAVATAEGSASIFANPAAPAVRPTTSYDVWDWDWHVDWLNPGAGTDFDNNGISNDEALTFKPMLTGGLVGQYRQWALGVYVAGLSNQQPLDADTDFSARVFSWHIVLGRSFFKRRLTIGAGVRIADFDVLQVQGGRSASLFGMTGASLETGAVWRPHDRDIRLGTSLSLPFAATDPDVQECDPLDCEGYILPGRIAVPWRMSAGVAWRRSATRWNRKVHADYRDEKYLLLAADVVVTGSVEDGYGIEAFSRMQLQPSGRDASVSLRGGAEYEWYPGRFRLRGGTYWEPSRFRDPMGDDVPGRLHLTLGFDARVWAFHLWGDPYRVRVSMTADAARRYGNTGVSVGLWH